MQNGIQAGLIDAGGVVKDSPGTNPIDLILQTSATPIISDEPQVYTPINQTNIAQAPTPDVLPNIAIIDASPAEKNNTGFILAAAGLGALLLFSKDGKKAVNGITGIGKKKKDSSLLPLILVGGAAAYWYFTKPPATSENSTPPPTDPPVTDPPANTATPPVTLNPAAQLQPLPNDTTIYNLLYAYSVPWRYAVDRMTPAEKVALYTYVFGYIKPGLHLYNYPGNYPDGFYDSMLYTEIQALSNKWNLGLLY